MGGTTHPLGRLESTERPPQVVMETGLYSPRVSPVRRSVVTVGDEIRVALVFLRGGPGYRNGRPRVDRQSQERDCLDYTQK